jgi:hypothetical protein
MPDRPPRAQPEPAPLQHGLGVGLLLVLAVPLAVLAVGGRLFARRDLAT